MAIEIERKYQVWGTHFMEEAFVVRKVVMAYLAVKPESVTRIAIVDDQSAWLTIKGKGTLSRPEFEYEIPLQDGYTLLNMREGDLIEKTRYKVKRHGLVWEVDVFHGKHDGLILAEVELPSENHPIMDLPEWIGEEVTGQPQYYNQNLALGLHRVRS